MLSQLIVVLLAAAVLGLDNGVGLKPPMGWNSWNHFGCQINETIIKQTADLLVSTGLAAKGYTYVNLDDCWQVNTEDI
jgi:alpha-galactosidase